MFKRVALSALPFLLTLVLWRVLATSAESHSQAHFETLRQESEHAVLTRLSSYANAARGAAVFFSGDADVTHAAWTRYVDSLDLPTNYPGILGLAWVTNVPARDERAFVERISKEDGRPFSVHPSTGRDEKNVITYLEPVRRNLSAIGLDLNFDDQRREALERATRTGLTSLSRPILLVQDEERSAGLLLVQPVTRPGADHQGWVAAPFIAREFLGNVTPGQDHLISLSVSDVTRGEPEPVYSAREANTGGAFRHEGTIETLGVRWNLVWRSTPEFERMESSSTPFLVLCVGLLLSVLIALLLNFAQDNRGTSGLPAGRQRHLLVPLATLVVVVVGSVAAYRALLSAETIRLRAILQDEGHRVSIALARVNRTRLTALSRMAHRWSAGDGTSPQVWHEDAKDLISQVAGIHALHWIDRNYQVRWAESEDGDSRLVGTDVRLSGTRGHGLTGDREQAAPFASDPFKLDSGEAAFEVYFPVSKAGKPDGFLATTVTANEFFEDVLEGAEAKSFSLNINYRGERIASKGAPDKDADTSWAQEAEFQIYDKRWNARVAPTIEFLRARATAVPLIVLLAGIVVAFFAGLAVRNILLVRSKARRLLESTRTVRQSEQQLRLLIEHTPAAVAMFDLDMRYIMTSRRWMEDYGLVGQQVIGRSHYEFFPEILNMPRWLDIHKRAQQGESFARREDSWLRANGQPEWNEWAIHPWVNSEGRAGGIVMFTEVITARKLAEAALRASEEENRAAMEHAPIGKALVYPNGRLAKVNPALCKLLGYSKEELLANDMRSITHPDDVGSDRKLFGKVILGEISSYELETRYFHRDGRTIWAQLSVAAVRRPTGETDFLVAQIQDISERKEMEHIKDEFVSVVSHELRTPLTSIRASLGLIAGLQGKAEPAKLERLVKISYDNCERLVRLVNDILDLDKITAGHMRLHCQPQNLTQITQSAVQTVEAMAAKQGVVVDFASSCQDVLVSIDNDRYVQVLINLLSNAVKFSPRDSRVQVRCVANQTVARVTVRDHGPGIPEEFQSRIFGKFEQAEDSATRRQGGTGLGLHITKMLVAKMGGTIGFETWPGEGTEFWVEFSPVAASAAQPAYGT